MSRRETWVDRWRRRMRPPLRSMGPKEEAWVVYNGGREHFSGTRPTVTRVRVTPNVAVARDAFARCAHLKEVDLSNAASIEIGEGAFRNCASLERIIVSSKTRAIGANAFKGCGKLREIDLSNVVTIGEGAFEGCKSLEGVIMPSGTVAVHIGANCFYECEKLNKVDLSNAVAIGEGAFRFCTSLECVIVSALDETTICDHAFHGCSRLKKVDIANAIMIGEKSFGWCPVEYIRIASASGVVMRADAFAYCTGLKEVDLSGAGAIIIAEGSFQYCTYLDCVRTPAAVARIGAPPSVSCEIHDRAFDGCMRLKEFGFDNVAKIGEEAFQWCSSLERTVIPSTTAMIGASAFHGCTKLENVDLSEGLRIIGNNAFHDCVSLECLHIPSTVAQIGANAFNGCNGLNEVTLGEGLVEFDHSTFHNCASLHFISIPSVAYIIPSGAFDYCLLRDETITPTIGQTVISKCLKSMSLNGQTEFGNKVNEILNLPNWSKEEKLDQIRRFLAYYEMIDATTVLELAIWKANTDGSIDQGTEARKRCRSNCGAHMNITMKGVLQFFDFSMGIDDAVVPT